MFYGIVRISLIIIILTYISTFGQEWVRRYDGPASNHDVGLDLALDQFGNCYVTGYSMNPSFNYDYATVKYSGSGIERWVRRYNGTSNRDDIARVIKINQFNQVFVAGSSYGFETNLDFLTIRYDTIGDEIWVKRDDNGMSNIDEIFDLAVDDRGNCYVTGYSTDTNYQYFARTIKYDSLSTTVWEKHYCGPITINNIGLKVKLDVEGNVYVAGYGNDTTGLNDYFVVKYDSAGNQVWVSTYNGTGNRNDYLKDLLIDTLGNIYVTGYSEGGNNNFDCATVKYNTAGNQRWVQRYNGTANQDDRGYRIAFDQYQNVYVVGFSDGMSTAHDFITLKYDSAGNELWQRRYNGPSNGDDVAKALVVDNDGNCFVTGHSYFGPINNDDYLIIKYDSAGNIVPVANYNGMGSGYDEPNQLIINPNGNLLVTGESYGVNTAADYATIKYRTVGIEDTVTINRKFEHFGITTLIVKRNQTLTFAEMINTKCELIISIFNVTGRQIKKQRLYDYNYLEVSELTIGIYFLIIETESNKKLFKLLIVD
jgi:hypothetical protein